MGSYKLQLISSLFYYCLIVFLFPDRVPFFLCCHFPAPFCLKIGMAEIMEEQGDFDKALDSFRSTKDGDLLLLSKLGGKDFSPVEPG